MAQATFSVRMEKGLKEQFDTLCKEFGMNASSAINVFARAVVRERRIPFEIYSPQKNVTRKSAMQAFNDLRKQAKQNGISDMTIDEINEEISRARKEAN